uniref:Plastid light harvesting protein n=1 Tax=Craspedostauros australis TaxID=1486917 RepID=A0A7R9WPH0_9STRA|mmetsp:Transcript_14708/g.40666  ORF Transcript_14708/g.40666 Transcript_14708/m.40666 type:complete len:204 (+) Transcript_14708:137-748(+)
MVKTLMIAAALAGTASAFAPSQSAPKAVTSLNEFANGLVGGEGPEPIPFSSQGSSVNWDPCGFTERAPEWVPWFREAELKHGRVAMAACLGWYLNAAGVHPAFDSSLSNNPLEAAQQLPLVGWVQFVLGCGAIEWLAEKIKDTEGYKAGDLLGASYWVDDTDEGWVDYQNKEINNGRLAMVAFMGIFVQALYFGNYGDMIFKN